MSEAGLFFDAHQWKTVEAAASRIIPTDHEPGAREANVVFFIDRYLSGTDFIYANPYGSGFLRLQGQQAEAWTRRIERLQVRYRLGLKVLDELARSRYGAAFAEVAEAEQDELLTGLLDGEQRSTSGSVGGPTSRAIVTSQPITEDELGFVETLILHTRQGFFADPAYGGNAGRVGWQVVGFDGPGSLAETVDGRFDTSMYLEPGQYEIVAPEVLSPPRDGADGEAL